MFSRAHRRSLSVFDTDAPPRWPLERCAGILAREARVDVGMRAVSSFTLSLTLRGVPSATRLRAPVPAPRAPLPSGTTPSVRRFAQPRDKLPSRSVDVKCRACDALLYKYRKGSKGSLVKCYLERITVDHTEAPCVCPACGQTFARPTLVRQTRSQDHRRQSIRQVNAKNAHRSIRLARR